MGPIIEPANGKLLHALTQLGDGEEWLVEPQQLDATRPALVARHPRRRRRRARTSTSPSSSDRCSASCTRKRPRRGDRAAERRRLRPDRRPALARPRRARALARPRRRRATSTSTAASPARSCSASRSAAGSARPSARARRRAGRTTCSASASGCRSTARPPRTLHLRGLETRVTELIEASQPSLDYESFECAAPLGAVRRGRVGPRSTASGQGRLGRRRRAQPVPLPPAARDDPHRRVVDAGRGAPHHRGRPARQVGPHRVDRDRAAEGRAHHPRRARGAGRPRGRRRMARSRRQGGRRIHPRAPARRRGVRRSPRPSAALRMSRCGRTP